MDRQELQHALCHYRSRYPEEAAYARQGCALLASEADCFLRSGAGLHITASCWVLNPAGDHTLLMLHRKLGRWFQPGGHSDGDENVLRVALKECSEETGLPAEEIHFLSRQIFDIDIHRIPARREEPEHRHLDIRFLMEIDDRLPLIGNSESHELRWVPLHEVHSYNRELSIHRLLVKSQEWLRQHRR
ncbi:NUDIX hydrolase [Acidithiobacillus sp. CV18-2]|uniref:NUDIX hydrolase n=1 Tax=Igneacidithiobacillus copahuensis TaxID=2724909 RepID=A0AAE3CKN6_9PROT|nr:NUDIX hydrolase [Igneacidithiobacillus copahuensis]MBU2754135.1 NUDIX hydrolase [Acidithiobacillus sp. CV18-3]MBU2757012.1 NUDIX hydrolase [Acidithiobacillus sp. BN09-2]MBU2777818.1 NUDIX hydrolase [Acidithiobacillus sp. CV18-2]MBU2795565.1 NUDIX hydrolase [Acidithiobacillus sp. VAN18-2]MBU2798793.1 NUDIX hydrolase [Acidithiobacillus sp. VAN18-4]UTV81804.1 NUDIX hydrolase [Acidithiobacillus sp. YTS05]